jgi:hypothetical protein
MLTLPQLIKKVNRFRKEGAQYVRILDVKKGYNTLGQGFIAASSYSTHNIGPDGRPRVNRDAHRYVTVITFLDRKLHVNVSCSCDDFKYRWETALSYKGAAEIEYSDGSPPDSTNPQLRTATCKHLYALWQKKLTGKIPGL